jgi:hypothetical protein
VALTKITPVYTCAVCGKRTNRLLGFAALVNVTGEQPARASSRIKVLGTCAAHRDQIPGRFAQEVAGLGEVVWVSDPIDLRPADVNEWYVVAQQVIVDAGREAGVLPDNASIPISSPEDVPQGCPHCGGELSWGTGPHVADAQARGKALAWECLDCRAAGLLG